MKTLKKIALLSTLVLALGCEKKEVITPNMTPALSKANEAESTMDMTGRYSSIEDLIKAADENLYNEVNSPARKRPYVYCQQGWYNPACDGETYLFCCSAGAICWIEITARIIDESAGEVFNGEQTEGKLLINAPLNKDKGQINAVGAPPLFNTLTTSHINGNGIYQTGTITIIPSVH